MIYDKIYGNTWKSLYCYYHHIKSIVLLNFVIVRAVEISNEFLHHFVPRLNLSHCVTGAINRPNWYPYSSASAGNLLIFSCISLEFKQVSTSRNAYFSPSTYRGFRCETLSQLSVWWRSLCDTGNFTRIKEPFWPVFISAPCDIGDLKQHNLVPRVLSFPSPLSRSREREGEDPGNEVVSSNDGNENITWK